MRNMAKAKYSNGVLQSLIKPADFLHHALKT